MDGQVHLLPPSSDDPSAYMSWLLDAYSKNAFVPAVNFQIGEDAGMLNQHAAAQPIAYGEDIENLEFGSETFIILGMGAHNGDNSTYMGAIDSRLQSIQTYAAQGTEGSFRIYLTHGMDDHTGISPQYLGLGKMTFEGVPPLSPQVRWAGGEVIHHDHAFILDHPWPPNDRDDLGSIKVLYTEGKAEYNFYQRMYEEALGFLTDNKIENVTTELFLPNFNVLLQESKTVMTEEDWNNVKIMSVDGDVDSNQITNVNYLIHSSLDFGVAARSLRPSKVTQKKHEELQGRTGNQYLDSWSKRIIDYPVSTFKNTNLKKVATKFKNIIYPLSALKDDDANILKASFPFYNEINFNTSTSNELADILRNSKLFNLFMLDYIQNVNSSPADLNTRMKDLAFHAYTELLGGKQTLETYNPDFKLVSPTLEEKNYRIYDFDSFARQVKYLNPSMLGSIEQILDDVISVSGEDNSDANFEILKTDPLMQLIYKMTFSSLYGSFVKEKLRTYRDIIQGQIAYSETLFYRVAKKNSQGDVIQNFYILNDSELDVVNLVDTQIRYGTKYHYEIFAGQLVVGNEYFYKKGPDKPADNSTSGGNPYKVQDHGPMGMGQAGPEQWLFNLMADTTQSVVVIELPYDSVNNLQVQESPPVPPNVNFIPYRGIDNKILIALNVGVDEYYDQYIPILPGEAESIDAGALMNEKGQTLFKSEGDVNAFELFRISELQMPDGPDGYDSFGAPNMAKRLILNRNVGDPTYVDNILPNTKYWYMFRTRDAKHNPLEIAPDFSNPTNVFEVQLINNDGAIYLTVNTYDISFFNEQKLTLEKQSIKTMRKYLHIQPSFDQTIINTDEDLGGTNFYDTKKIESIKTYVEDNINEHVSDFKLGYTKESVFGNLDNDDNNKFKVRLTSKKTGRKIDIFLRFKKPVLEK